MSAMSDKLKALGYSPFIKTDHHSSEALANLSSVIGRPVPETFARFLLEYPDTGMFDQLVSCLGIEAAPSASDRLYPISMLYASCSDLRYDLLEFRKSWSAFPNEYLVFGDDVFANMFLLDLTDSGFGTVKYKSIEEDWDGKLYLLAEDFESFVLNMRSEPYDTKSG